MHANKSETFVNMCADMLLKFQWYIEKHRFNALDLAPQLISMSPLRLMIREATQICSSKFDMIRRYIVLNRQTPIFRLLFLHFSKWKNIIPFKIKLVIRSSNLIKSNLQNMNPYERESNKENIETLENATLVYCCKMHLFLHATELI